MKKETKDTLLKLWDYFSRLFGYIFAPIFLISLFYLASDKEESLREFINGFLFLFMLIIYFTGVKYWLDKACANTLAFGMYKQYETFTRVFFYLVSFILLGLAFGALNHHRF